MFTRRKILAALGLLATAMPARAEQVILIDRASPQRKPMLDAVRAPVEQRLGIRVIFVVERLAVFGDWAFAELHPRTEAGTRIDYRHTRYARHYIPDQDSDLVLALLRRAGPSWVVVQEAFLPTDVVWEDWVKTYRLPRRLFLDQ